LASGYLTLLAACERGLNRLNMLPRHLRQLKEQCVTRRHPILVGLRYCAGEDGFKAQSGLMDELRSPTEADHPRLNIGHEKLLYNPF